MTKDPKKYNVLVVEDNPGDFALIEDYLKEQIATPKITHAKNLKEVELLFDASINNYDVLLLDLSLPDKSGEALIEAMQALCHSCPIIVLTGYSDIDFSIKSLSLGVDDYLLKDDINASSLYKSIVYNIERKKANANLLASEERYSNLFHLSPQSMWVYDVDTLHFIQVNNAAVAHYGFSESEFLAMRISDIMLEENVHMMKETLSIPNANKEALFNGRFRHYKKLKDIIEVDIYSSPIIINDKEHRLVIAVDVTQKVLFEHEITKAIIKTQEDERYEIGSELHDNVSQLLVATQMSIGMLQKSLPPSAMQWLNQSKEYLTLASHEMRNISHRLAPAFFEDISLEETFKKLLDIFNIEDKYTILLHFDAAVKECALNRDIQLNLYRILQEQLKNILKYANATTIQVDAIISNNKLIMQTSDNGVGFDITTVKNGIGLANMKRRAEVFSGTIAINTLPGNGCKITITIPIKKIN